MPCCATVEPIRFPIDMSKQSDVVRVNIYHLFLMSQNIIIDILKIKQQKYWFLKIYYWKCCEMQFLTICHNASHWLKCSDTPIILQLYEEIFNVTIRIILCLYDLIIIDRFTHFRIRQNFTNFAFDVSYYQNLLYFDFNFHCTLFDEKTVNIKTKYHFAFFVFHVTGKHW